MKQGPRLILLVGVILLLAGAYFGFGAPPPQADPAAVAQCRERMQDQGPEMLARCQEAAFATAMTATDANQAAAAISASNNSEVAGHTMGMFLLGMGLVLTVAGVLAWRRQARGAGVDAA